MQEENKENWESNQVNSENNKTYTQKELDAILRKNQSNMEEWVQKVVNEKKLVENAMQELKNIATDNTHLINLYDSNPDVANYILNNYYNWIDIETFKEEIWYKEDLTDPKKLERLIDKKTAERLNQLKIEDTKNSFIEKMKMSEDEKKKFEQEFLERTELKSFKISDIEKHLEKAYRDTMPNYTWLDINKLIGQNMAMSEWNSTNNKIKWVDPNIEYLKRYWKL